MKMPGAEQAIVPATKVRDYLLSSDHRVGSAKAKFFAQPGFEQQDWPVLLAELGHLATEEALPGDLTKFGQKYVVAGTIHGPSGRRAQVVTVWIVLNADGYPRFVTAYPGVKS